MKVDKGSTVEEERRKIEKTIQDAAKTELGVSKGGKVEDKETWWWTEDPGSATPHADDGEGSAQEP